MRSTRGRSCRRGMVRTGSGRWRRWATPWGLLEGIVTWIRVLVSPEPQLAAVAIAREADWVNRAADALERAIARAPMRGGWMRRRSFWARRCGWRGDAIARMGMAREAICPVQLV